MTYRGRVKNGVVVIEKRVRLPEGMAVSIRPLKGPMRPAAKARKRPPTVYERLKSIVGIVKDLPPDFALNHDHYLYGAPKRK